MNAGEKRAGYKYLLGYQYTVVIYDFTVEFCRCHYPGREYLRQRDQMIQAARSGKQNIAEGSSLESLESYIKLAGVARGSLKELLEDYEDFIRQNQLKLWSKESKSMRKMRGMRVVMEPFPHIPHLPHLPQNPELAANLMIMLCNRTTYLLDKLIESLKTRFTNRGGFRENLFQKRLIYKKINQI